jgi:hypothetical protein
MHMRLGRGRRKDTDETRARSHAAHFVHLRPYPDIDPTLEAKSLSDVGDGWR